MAYRNGNYTAFYVREPFGSWAYSVPDFCYYQTLRVWKGRDPSFPFNDSHDKNYNVRDGSSWEYTLKPRLRERLRNSKNIILFLSSNTKASRALTEEIEYGIGVLGLPVIVVYPEFDPIDWSGHISGSAVSLWNSLPTFKRLMGQVPTLHVPMKKDVLRNALTDLDFMVSTKTTSGCYRP